VFIAEGGPECLSDKKEAIQHCMNITLSKFIPKDQVTVDNIPVLKLEKEECTYVHICFYLFYYYYFCEGARR
jgi:Protein of unknown function (DUF1397).